MTWSFNGVFKNTLLMAVILGLGLGIGAAAAWGLRAYKSSKLEAQREALTRSVVERMTTVRVGDKLRDFTFEDLSGKPAQLSDQLQGLTWIGVIEPGCETCIQSLSDVGETVSKSVSSRHFLFISGSDPRDLSAMRLTAGLSSRFLHDQLHRWSNSYNINAFPFYMLVDTALVVHEIEVGGLSSDQMKRAE